MPKKQSARLSAKAAKTLLYPLGVAALLATIVLVAYHERHTSFLIEATTRQPQPYTELYFTSPGKLPSITKIGQSLAVSFTLHNVEGRNVTYTYDINFTTADGRTTLLRHQQLSLANGRTAVATSPITIPTHTGREEISVVLEHRPEAIHYWTEVRS